MWRLRVVHSTGYAYKSPATASFNEARLTPRSDNRQNVILSRVETVPATRSYRYIDYWGTAVTAFDLHAPHTELEVTASSVVETDKPEPPDREASPGTTWRARPWSISSTRCSARRITPPRSKRLRRVGEKIAKYNDPQDAVIAASEWVNSELDYVPGTTGRALVGARRAARGQGRLPGLRPPDAGGAAQHRHSGPLCIRLPASARARHRSATRSTGRATRGSRHGPAAGGTTTRRMTKRSTSSTSASASAGTTPTSRR